MKPPAFQTSPPPPPLKKKKKKKKKKRGSEVQEESLAPPPQNSPPPPSLQKKKKRRSEVLEESLAPPSPPPPPSLQKKKKRRSEVQEESLAPPPQTSPPPASQNKSSEVLEEAPAPLTSPQKKKKKKRRSEVQEESPAPPPQTSPPPASQNKRSSEVLEEAPAPLPSPQKKKKKKKRRSEFQEESPALPPQTCPPPASQNKSSEVLEEAPAPLTSPQKKKKKKRTSEILEEAPAPPPQKKKRTSEGLEERPPPSPASSPPPSSLPPSPASSPPPPPPASSLPPSLASQKKRRSGGLEEPPPPQSSSQDQLQEEQCNEIWWDSALMKELEEFFPNVKKKSIDQIRKLVRYDLPRFKLFKQQGLSLRTGRCTQEENRMIAENVSDFLALTGIPTAEQLLFPRRFKGHEAEIKKLKIQHHFLERIAEGIPRTCEQIYTRARKLFDERNHMGRFSEEEICTLQKLHSLHGNDWKTISEKMDRSVYAVEKRFRSLSSRHGSWDPDEESRLKKAVRTHLKALVQENSGSGLTKDQLCINLPWKMISEQVQTRAWSQCRLKWFSILQPRLTPGRRTFNRGVKGVLNKIQLIDTMYQMNVDDLADVDWNVVADCIGNVSPILVQKTFHRIKFHKVPHWSTLSLGEILDFLHDRILPQLQESLRKRVGRHRAVEAGLQEDDRQLQENDQQLSFIFTDDDDDDEEVDNSGLPIEIQLQTRE